MSRENVDLYRKVFDAIGRGDWDAVAAKLDPDIVVRTDPGWPEQRIYGRHAYTAFIKDTMESMGPDFRIDEIVDLGDRVLARWCWKTVGQQSGIGGELRYSEIVTYREGLVILIEHFRDHEHALEALGMRGESGMSANLDLVRSIVADWERGDYSRGDWADPEIEYVYPDEGPELDTTTTGVSRMNERWREMLDAWHETRYETTAVRELDLDRVLVLARFTGRGKMSGLELGKLGQVATVFHLSAGKVTKLISYDKAANAFADLGLTPDE